MSFSVAFQFLRVNKKNRKDSKKLPFEWLWKGLWNLKTLNEINPPYRKIYSKVRQNSIVRQNDILVKRINTSSFGTQRLRSVGLKILNNLPSNVKSETSFPKFKEHIKTWLGTNAVKMFSCSLVYIYIYQVFTYIYSYLYFLEILARIWSVFVLFMHGLYFFIFVYMQIYFFPRINKAFIHHSYFLGNSSK